MHPEESLYPADWLRIAEKDLNRAEYLLEDDSELAGFCLQQGAEKLLKAFLLSQSKLEFTRPKGLAYFY